MFAYNYSDITMTMGKLVKCIFVLCVSINYCTMGSYNFKGTADVVFSIFSHLTSGKISRYIPGCKYASPWRSHDSQGKKPMQACKYTTCTVHLAKAGRGTPTGRCSGIGKWLFLLLCTLLQAGFYLGFIFWGGR